MIEKYRQKLWNQLDSGIVKVEDLASLHEKKLVCWCHPLPCHGDVLEKAAEWAYHKLYGAAKP